MSDPALTATIIDQIAERIAQRAHSRDPETSYTARLRAGGAPLIARKLGEEAIETIIEALAAPINQERLAEESADVLYHLLVLWSACGLEPQQVWQVLARRLGAGEEEG